MYKSQENIVKSYRNKAIVLKDFADMYETNKEMKKADASAQYDLYNFNVEFAPIAWMNFAMDKRPNLVQILEEKENARRIGVF